MTSQTKLSREWIQEKAVQYNKDPSFEMENKLERSILESLNKSKTYVDLPTLALIEEWKWGRKRGLVSNNDNKYVEEVTRLSFATDNERLKLEVLTLLDGVDYPMASTILFFSRPEHYSVIDSRAWKSLQYFDKIESGRTDYYGYEAWRDYTNLCRELAQKCDVTLRDLDKALWLFNGGS